MAKQKDFEAPDAVSEPQAVPAPTPAPYVNGGATWGVYEVTMPASRAGKTVTLTYPDEHGRDLRELFSAPDETTKTVRTSKAAAADMKRRGWTVKAK